jgi:hypothetical protein
LPGFNEKVPLIRCDVLTIVQSKHDFSLSNWSADRYRPNAGFLPKFSERCLLKCLAFVNGTAGSGPKILPGKCSVLIGEPEEQNASGEVDDEEAGGGSAAQSH